MKVLTEYWHWGGGTKVRCRCLRSDWSPLSNWYFFHKGYLQSNVTKWKQNTRGYGGLPGMVRLTASTIIFKLEKHPDGGKSQVDVNNPPLCPFRASPLHGQIQGGRRCLLIQIYDLLFSVGWIWWILVSSFLLIPVYCCAFPEIGLAFFFFLEQSVQTYSSQSVSSKDDSSCWGGGGGIRGVLTPVFSSSCNIVMAEYCLSVPSYTIFL